MSRSLAGMRDDWDRRAEQDALYWVYTVFGKKYDDIGAYYEDGIRQASELLGSDIERWNEDPTGKTILEIGSGIGRLMPGFAKLGFSRIIGVDVSPQMLKRAEEWCPPTAGVEFLHVPGDRLPGVSDNSVDYCFSYNVLQHAPNQAIIRTNIEEMARVLRKDAYFQLHFRGGLTFKRRVARRLPQGVFPLARMILRGIRGRTMRRASNVSGTDPGHERTWELGAAVAPKVMRKWLADLGMTDVRIERDTQYPDGYRYWARGRKPATA